MKQTDTVLDKIIGAKKANLKEQKLKKPFAQLRREADALTLQAGPGFFEALKAPEPRLKLIAEVKRASPSAGVLRQSFSLPDINRAYQTAPQVAAISVLTERDYFQGSDSTLAYFAANNTYRKPLLRKDFIFDPYQVLESKLLGAQAYLLIAALFTAGELSELVDLGLELGIEPLVEVHDEHELKIALTTQARCIGVNSRDLKTFEVDNKRHELLRQLDDSYARVAESGINDAEYLAYVSDFADAALVGGHLMAADNIVTALEKLANPAKKGVS